MQNQNDQNLSLASIETSQLASVTGGGLFGTVLKLGEKALPLAKKALPVIGHKAVQAAKWTGIPAGLGAATSWVKHEFTR
ncbi:MAG TPA: hypothetical protein VHW23_24135 [Kofleriaceae bacterium]|jgi:hypothetical protein|nr:hypothetical protein [Kofleriaceae bacterium]